MNTLLEEAKELGLSLDGQQLRQFDTYLVSLALWNHKCNLTAITDANEIVHRHFVDSLTCAPLLNNYSLHKHLRILDVGTGAGFPGLPLKIVFPEIDLSLMESKTKKCLFLQELVEKLALDNVEVINGRAEILGHDPGYRENFDRQMAQAVWANSIFIKGWIGLAKNGAKVAFDIFWGMNFALLLFVFRPMRNYMKEMWTSDRELALFLALWIAPPFLFYLFIIPKNRP